MREVAPDVYEFTREEQREAVAKALNLCGHTYDELRKMASEDSFDSLLSQRVWVAVADMATFAPS